MIMITVKKLSQSGILIIAFLLFHFGCVTEPDIENYPEVSFLNDITPILSSNCSQSGCHGAVNPEEFTLITYEDVMRYVKVGNARESKLYQAITDRGDEFMPPSPSSPLSDQQISTILVWIEQGAPNN